MMACNKVGEQFYGRLVTEKGTGISNGESERIPYCIAGAAMMIPFQWEEKPGKPKPSFLHLHQLPPYPPPLSPPPSWSNSIPPSPSSSSSPSSGHSWAWKVLHIFTNNNTTNSNNKRKVYKIPGPALGRITSVKVNQVLPGLMVPPKPKPKPKPSHKPQQQQQQGLHGMNQPCLYTPSLDDHSSPSFHHSNACFIIPFSSCS